MMKGEARRKPAGLSRRPKVPRPPPPSSAAATRSMKGNRASGTTPERLLRAALRDMGITRYELNFRGIPGCPDVAFPSVRFAVFVHGCFWHRCPRHRWKVPKSNADYWRLKFASNRERDARKVRALRRAGWAAVTLWECKIKRDPESCALAVQRRLLRRELNGA